MYRHKIPHWTRCGIFSIVFLLNVFPAAWLPAQSMPGIQPVPKVYPSSIDLQATQTIGLRILALRVAFTPDENRSTTGDGQFLMTYDNDRCDGFLVDPPPHGVSYFRAQIKAVANYFEQVSDGAVSIDQANSDVFPDRDEFTITVGSMAAYRPTVDEDSSDALLVNLYAESVRAAVDSGVAVRNYDIIVVLHAGIGQDFAYPGLDPTPLDIPSAMIDRQMIFDALGTEGIAIHPDSALIDKPGLILPEGQNHIYYDIVEDIFPRVTDFCDIQIGLTGTFALLMGYALGFPPLYDTDDGEPGVGVFGLMDIGSNNGQGVIPAPPTAWTRVHLGWEEPEELVGDILLPARHLHGGKIGRIDLGLDEYYLIENRSNWIPGQSGVSLDTLRYRDAVEDQYGGYVLPHYFDYLRDYGSAEVDSATGVIVSVPNYDLGMPGSGLLIWHVDQTRYNSDMVGINDIPEARAVALVEADGAVDIGFPTTALFGDPDLGWVWDMWYAGNEAFFVANPERERNNPAGYLDLDADTHPSTHLNSGAESGIAIVEIDSASLEMGFTVEDVGVIRLPVGSQLLGYNGVEFIYALGDSVWLGNTRLCERSDTTETSELPVVVSEHDAIGEEVSHAFWIVENRSASGYIARRFILDGSLNLIIEGILPYSEVFFHQGLLHVGISEGCCPVTPDTSWIWYYEATDDVASWGYLHATDRRSLLLQGEFAGTGVESDSIVYWTNSDYVSMGDLDGDGYDEIAAAGNSDIGGTDRLTAANADQIVLDGFPIPGQFSNAPLIANLAGDIRPELVVASNSDIIIFGPEGDIERTISLRTSPQFVFLAHISDGTVGLANGDRIHLFGIDPTKKNSQWLTAEGRHSRNRHSLNDGIMDVQRQAAMDVSRVYNYPNPVTRGSTTIRFFTGEASRARIRIFTIDGLQVTETELAGLAQNDYNEWIWEVGDQPSGIYYGLVEVEGAEKVSALIKIAVVR